MIEKICQSCGMPMTVPEHFGTNADNSANGEYCVYCFENGNFTSSLSLDETVAEYANDADALKDENGKPVSREDFITKTKAFLSTLKRWKIG